MRRFDLDGDLRCTLMALMYAVDTVIPVVIERTREYEKMVSGFDIYVYIP